MTINIENGRRFEEEPAIESDSSEADIVLTRLANGTGVKALTIGAVRDFIAGEVAALKTKEKGSLVSAINELADTDADLIAAISALKDIAANYDGAGPHNSIYRGKNLGTSVTEAQWKAIKAGTFKDLYIGDYWTINGVTWRIAAFDYYLHSGDTECTKHHVTIVPDDELYKAQMNTEHTTNGGYAGSAMR